jgi:hypothetical protein
MATIAIARSRVCSLGSESSKRSTKDRRVTTVSAPYMDGLRIAGGA